MCMYKLGTVIYNNLSILNVHMILIVNKLDFSKYIVKIRFYTLHKHCSFLGRFILNKKNKKAILTNCYIATTNVRADLMGFGGSLMPR